MKFFPPLLTLAAAACLGMTMAQAQNYSVNFLGSTTDAVTATAGVVPLGGFNNIPQQAASFVITDQSSLNPATLTLSGPGANNGYRTVPANGDGGNSSLMHGYIDASGAGGPGTMGPGIGSVTLTLSGLTGVAYNVYLYDLGDLARPSNFGDGYPEYTVNGTNYYTATLSGAFNGFVQGQTQSTQLSSFPPNPTLTPGNYIVISNVAPIGGTITLQANADNRTFRSQLDGFQLIAVPEPSTATIVVVGLLGAISWRVNRRGRLGLRHFKADV